jgi:probable HAF family extracellular repeat protein
MASFRRATPPTTGFRAFTWSAGGMVNLGTLPGGTYSAGRAVSDNGSVAVGWSGSPVGPSEFSHACRWTGGVMTDLGTLGAATP